MAPLIWIASYPKSGNTWVRAFFANYMRDQDRPVDINGLDIGTIASDRHMFDEFVGVEASDLPMDKVTWCRPEVFRCLAEELTVPVFIKAHDAGRISGRLLAGRPPKHRTIYVIRNPLDVCVSMMHHYALEADEAIEWLSGGFAISSSQGRLNDQLAQFMPPWSGHVCSWVDEPEISAHVVRYEDLITDPVGTWRGLVAAAGLDLDEEALVRAVAFSSFREMQTQERTAGFRERPIGADTFFRRGRPGGWRDELTLDQVRRLARAHGDVMRRFGYAPGPAGELADP